VSIELHPELSAAERDRLLREGVERFNAGRFFDAHESWEEIWRSTTPEPADLFRGLIQVAVGLYHYLESGKRGPARRVLARGLRRVEPVAPAAEGLDQEAFVADAARWEAWLEAGEGDPPPPPRLQDRLPTDP
jgi:hypothetical protein